MEYNGTPRTTRMECPCLGGLRVTDGVRTRGLRDHNPAL